MPEAGTEQYAEFHEMGQRKAPWDERAQRIRERFPSVHKLDWDAAFARDMDLFARVLRDILKLEQAQPGRPGPRPSLDVPSATRRLQQFLGRDYTIEPFPVAFRILAGDRSVRHLARKVNLPRATVHRLLTGEQEPDPYRMQEVAKGFGKAPSYFLEYRMLYIIAALSSRLEWSPDTTIDLYRTLVHGVTRGPTA